MWFLCLQRQGRNLTLFWKEPGHSPCTTCSSLLRSLCMCMESWRELRDCWRTRSSGAVNSHWRHPAVTSKTVLDVKQFFTSGVHNKWTSQRGIYLTSRYNHKQTFFFAVTESLSLAFITLSLEQLDPGNSIKYKMKAQGTGSNTNWN